MSDNNQGKETPKGFEQHVPSGKSDRGPSMKERLIAQRRAEAEAQAKGGAKPASAPAPKPAAKAPTKPVSAAKPARAAAKPQAAAGEAAAESKPTRPGRAAAGSSRRSSTRAGGSSRRRGEKAEGDEAEEGEGRRRGGKPKQKNLLLPVVGVVAVLALAGVGIYKIYSGGETEAAPKDLPNPDDANLAPAEGQVDQAAADAAAAKAAEAKAAKESKAKEDAAAAKAAAEQKATESADSGAPQVKRKNGKQVLLRSVPDDLYDVNDPAEPDLGAMERFGKPEGCSDAMWTEIQGKVADMIDPDAGAAGTRAAKSLEKDYGQYAFPALVNALLGLNYSTQAGHETGDFIQRTLMNLANGRNADWNYDFAEMPNLSTIANRRTVAVLYDVWAKVEKDPSYWEKYAGATEAAKRAKGDAAGAGDAAPADDKPADSGIDDLLPEDE